MVNNEKVFSAPISLLVTVYADINLCIASAVIFLFESYTTRFCMASLFGIFASLVEFEGDLILERTMAGLSAARARGRKGGRKFELTKAQVRLAQAAMSSRDSRVSELCREVGITRTTLYRYISPTGQLREAGNKVLNRV